MASTVQQIFTDVIKFISPSNPQPAKPALIKVISGQDRYNDKSTSRGQTSISVPAYTMFDDYTTFNEIAFFTHGNLTPVTLIHIISLLFGSYDRAIEFIHLLNTNNPQITFYQFAKYLYYEKGIMFINRDKIISSASLPFRKKISHILDIGEKDIDCTQNVAKVRKSIKYGQILHCSSKQQYHRDMFNTWYQFDNNAIKNILPNNSKVNFSDFHI